MSDQTKIYTTGPVDPNASQRGKLYATLTVLTPLLSALATFGILNDDQANASIGFITSAVGLASAFGFGLAAKKTGEQVKNGTFEAAPANPVVDAFDALSQIKAQVDETVNNATSQVAHATAVIQGAAAMIPGGASVTNAILTGPVGDLIQMVSDRAAAADAVDNR